MKQYTMMLIYFNGTLQEVKYDLYLDYFADGLTWIMGKLFGQKKTTFGAQWIGVESNDWYVIQIGNQRTSSTGCHQERSISADGYQNVSPLEQLFRQVKSTIYDCRIYAHSGSRYLMRQLFIYLMHIKCISKILIVFRDCLRASNKVVWIKIMTKKKKKFLGTWFGHSLNNRYLLVEVVTRIQIARGHCHYYIFENTCRLKQHGYQEPFSNTNYNPKKVENSCSMYSLLYLGWVKYLNCVFIIKKNMYLNLEVIY